jgi:RNA polymerase sigma-70 factor (ECF subfamily)
MIFTKNPQKKFGKIYDEYIEKLYRFVFLKTNSAEIAEDIVSETFLRGWKAFSNQANNGKEIKQISSFLYRIAKNLIIDHYRQKAKVQIISFESVTKIANDDKNFEKVNRDTEIASIKKVLQKLPDDYQDIIIWHYLEDLSVPEIAQIMEKSEEAVRVQLSRALKALKTELGVIKEPDSAS